MTFYIAGPVQNDPSVLKQRGVDYLTAYAPAGWQLQPGDPIDLMLEFFSLVAAEQADVANALLDSAFRYFGGLVNTPPIDAVPASSSATFTVDPNATVSQPVTIPAGSVVGLIDATGTLQGFALLSDLVIATGITTGTGTVQAQQAGVICNALSGTAQLVQVPSFVTAATLATSAGGVDAELDQAYLDRLAESLTIQSPRFILAADGAILARSIAGVYRAAGVDNLKPGPPYDGAAEATGVARNTTVAVADINGLTVGATIRNNVKTFLQSFREQNEVVWVVDPQYTAIDVSATVYSWPGQVTSVVQAAVVAALQSALSPALFGTDPSGTAARWRNDPVIRSSLIQAAIMAVPGVRYVSPAPTFAVHLGALGTADVTLGAGSAIPALPTAGTLTVTVTATT